MDPQRGDVWWVSLGPTQGAEIKKTRPCLILTKNVLNSTRKTVVIVPFSTASNARPPVTVAVKCQGVDAIAVIDQVRAVAKHRLRSRIESASAETIEAVTAALEQVLEIS